MEIPEGREGKWEGGKRLHGWCQPGSASPHKILWKPLQSKNKQLKSWNIVKSVA